MAVRAAASAPRAACPAKSMAYSAKRAAASACSSLRALPVPQEAGQLLPEDRLHPADVVPLGRRQLRRRRGAGAPPRSAPAAGHSPGPPPGPLPADAGPFRGPRPGTAPAGSAAGRTDAPARRASRQKCHPAVPFRAPLRPAGASCDTSVIHGTGGLFHCQKSGCVLTEKPPCQKS